MNGISIEFLVGLYLLATSVDGSANNPSIHLVRLIIGLVLVLIAIFGVDLLALR